MMVPRGFSQPNPLVDTGPMGVSSYQQGIAPQQLFTGQAARTSIPAPVQGASDAMLATAQAMNSRRHTVEQGAFEGMAGALDNRQNNQMQTASEVLARHRMRAIEASGGQAAYPHMSEMVNQMLAAKDAASGMG